MGRLVYFLDSNIFLEALLNQDKALEVESFFKSTGAKELFISDLSLFSIGIILFKFKKFNAYNSFIENIQDQEIKVLSLIDSLSMNNLISTAKNFNLDFEDSYQYLIAKKYNLELIGFDKDFDRTELKRKEPTEIIKQFD